MSPRIEIAIYDGVDGEEVTRVEREWVSPESDDIQMVNPAGQVVASFAASSTPTLESVMMSTATAALAAHRLD